jgi:hypothetical protein
MSCYGQSSVHDVSGIARTTDLIPQRCAPAFALFFVVCSGQEPPDAGQGPPDVRQLSLSANPAGNAPTTIESPSQRVWPEGTPRRLAHTCGQASFLMDFVYAPHSGRVVYLDEAGEQCLWTVRDGVPEQGRASSPARSFKTDGILPEDRVKPEIADSGNWGIVFPWVEPATAIVFPIGEADTLRKVRPFRDRTAQVQAAVFIESERHVLFVSTEGEVADWSRVESRVRRRFMASSSKIVRVSDDSSLLLLGTGVWEIDRGLPIAVPGAASWDLLDARFLPGERTAVLFDRSGDWIEVNLPLSGEPSVRTTPTGLTPTWARMDARSRTALVSDSHSTNLLWVEPLRTQVINNQPIHHWFQWEGGAIWSPDGSLVAIQVSFEKTLVFSTVDGEPVAALLREPCLGGYMTFGPGRSLLTFKDGEVCIWPL